MLSRNTIPLAVLGSLAPLATAWAQASETYGNHPHMGGGWGWGWGWGGMMLGPLMMIAVIAVVVVVIVLVMRFIGVGGAGQAPSGGGTALDILAKRYARGEIDREEFEERKRILSG